jgi:pimeloyl-ACP methyl ester carboxylesterase
VAFFHTKDGTRLYYRTKGTGKPIVLIHGWSNSHEAFLIQEQQLCDDYHVVTYDLRGHGKSDKPQQGLSLHTFAKDLKELLEHLELEDALLVGWSMGTSVIFEYLRHFNQEHISKVCFVDMTPKLLNDKTWKLGLYHGSFTEKDNFNALTTIFEDWPSYAKTFIKATIPYLTEEQIEQLFHLKEDNLPHVMAAMWLSMSANDYRDVLPSITVPSLIIYGTKSTLYSEDTAQYMAQHIKHSTLLPFEGCTHFLVGEQPHRFTEAIRNFATEKSS